MTASLDSQTQRGWKMGARVGGVSEEALSLSPRVVGFGFVSVISFVLNETVFCAPPPPALFRQLSHAYLWREVEACVGAWSDRGHGWSWLNGAKGRKKQPRVRRERKKRTKPLRSAATSCLSRSLFLDVNPAEMRCSAGRASRGGYLEHGEQPD